MKRKTSDLLSRRAKWVFSALIAVHLAAIVLPPLAFQTTGMFGLSPAVETLIMPVRPYTELLYMDRGYAFFAPDPGPSHLIQAAIDDSNGLRTEIMIPDRQRHWPRLLYHRHFMLSEFLQTIYQAPGPPKELVREDSQAAEFWARARNRYERLRLSIVEHLEKKYPGQDVQIRRIEHRVPDLVEFRERSVVLTEPRFYSVLLDQQPTDPDEQLAAPDRPPEKIPSPQGDRDNPHSLSYESSRAAESQSSGAESTTERDDQRGTPEKAVEPAP